MGLSKAQIRERLLTRSTWVTNVWASVFPDLGGNPLNERQMRYVVYIALAGNTQNTVGVAIRLQREGVSGPRVFSPISVAPADFIQIPPSHDIEDPIVQVEGGGDLFAHTKVTGHSVNVTVQYWDHTL